MTTLDLTRGPPLRVSIEIVVAVAVPGKKVGGMCCVGFCPQPHAQKRYRNECEWLVAQAMHKGRKGTPTNKDARIADSQQRRYPSTPPVRKNERWAAGREIGIFVIHLSEMK